jgi:hypothetical protein
VSDLLRKPRGVMGIGLIWGMAWAAIGAVLSTVVGVVDPDSIDPGEGPVRVGAILGMVGLVSGVAFGALMAIAESGRAILSISLRRAAMWGVLSSAAFPLLTQRQDQVLTLCHIGAAVALASVAIARNAARGDSKRPSRLRDILSACVLKFVRDTVDPPTESST